MRKHIVSVCCAVSLFALFFCAFPVSVTAGDSPDYLYAARKTVDLYALPEDTAESVRSVPLGSIMLELEELPTGWIKVQTMDGESGWVEKLEVSEDMPTRVYAQHHTVSIKFCPSLECPEIEKIGFSTEIMELDEDDDWVQVVLPNGVVGWIEEDAVSDEPPKRYTVIVPNANLRACPDDGCPQISTLTSGAVVTRMDKKDDWYNVFTDDGVSGWIYEELVVREEKAHQIPGLGTATPETIPAPPTPQG